MKKLILSLVTIATISLTSFGQAPEGFKYQAVVRDAGNVILNNQSVGVQLTIQQGSIGGTAVYTETFATTSNAYGLVNLEIGSGTTTDDFSTIDWANGPYFIETAVDVTGGTSYIVMGTSQLMSVPYALYAKNSGTSVESDPIFNGSVSAGITAVDTMNWNNDNDIDSTNEYNTSVILNGTDLETTDGGGTIITDLSSLSGGGANWTLSGTNIYNSNTGNVGVGLANPYHEFAVGRTDSSSALAIGHIGNFNEVYSGQLMFSEDISYNGDCGIKITHNGGTNSLYYLGGCTTFADTAIRINRSGYTNIRNLRLGTDYDVNSTIPLTVDGLSSFNGNMTITGNLNVTGTIAKGGGTFKIDHPQDPANKYLVHSFVESPEMMNIYSGNIITDENGFATVELPTYFEAANKDFRYQLTVIGTFAQAIVKEKVLNNKFVIQTNEPNTEVSWSVTGVRSDKFANANRVVDVVEKELKGTYIHPELYGASQEDSEAARKAKIAREQEVKRIGADQQ